MRLKELKAFIARRNKQYHPVIVEMLRPYVDGSTRVLDVGCWNGDSALYYRKTLGLVEIYGIDCFERSVNAALEKGVKGRRCDLEKDSVPFESDYFDIVIANQVFEHIKNMYHALTEIYRVLKPTGYLLFGVPNLASLHNRFLVALGKQPTCIQMFDEHIRAFTPGTLIKFLTFNDLFRVVKFRGIGFYPLIPPVSSILSRVFPKASVIMMILLRKNHFGNPVTWQDEVSRTVKQTNY